MLHSYKIVRGICVLGSWDKGARVLPRSLGFSQPGTLFREDDADRIFLMRLAKRTKETIDGDLLSFVEVLRVFQDGLPVARLEVFGRWDHIDMIPFDLDGVGDLRVSKKIFQGLQSAC